MQLSRDRADDGGYLVRIEFETKFMVGKYMEELNGRNINFVLDVERPFVSEKVGDIVKGMAQEPDQMEKHLH